MISSAAEVRHATALKWFEVHASQRMQLLAGYLAGMGFVSGSIGAALTARLPIVVTVLALLLATITWVFDRLDSRTKQLVKVAEDVLSDSLAEIDPSHSPSDIVARSNQKNGTPSYRDSFKVLYVVSYGFAAITTITAWMFLR